MDSPLLTAALSYAERGWPVLPLHNPTTIGRCSCGQACPKPAKHPRLKHGLTEASVNPDTIQRWWNRWPNANIGVCTGVGCDGIDCDGAGMAIFIAWCADHGMDPFVYPRASTGRSDGGRHILISPTGYGNRTRLLPHIDFRGAGGYLVAPPSLHISGTHYAWKQEPNGTIPRASSAFLELLAVPERTASDAQPMVHGATPWGRRALDEEVRLLRTAREGERNDELNRRAFRLFQLVPEHLDQAVIHETMAAAARAIGLDELEIRRTLQSAMDGIDSPRGPAPTPLATVPVTVLETPLPPDRPWLQVASTWAAEEDVERAALIPRVLPSQGIVFLAGEPKTGKTWVALSTLLSVTTGLPFLGTFEVATPGRCLYIATEGQKSSMIARLRSLARAMDIDPDQALDGFDISWRRGVILDDPTWMERLLEVAADYVLIVIDNLRDVTTSKESSPDERGALMRHLRSITDLGPTVELVHHFNQKSQDNAGSRSGQRLRGTTVQHGALDAALYLHAPKNSTRVLVECESRDDIPAGNFTLAVPPPFKVDGVHPFDLDYQTEDVEGEGGMVIAELIPAILAVVVGEPGITSGGVADRVKGRRRDVLKALSLAVDKGAIHVRLGPRNARLHHPGPGSTASDVF